MALEWQKDLTPEQQASIFRWAGEQGVTFNDVRYACQGTRHELTDDNGMPVLDPQGNPQVKYKPCTAGPGGAPTVSTTLAHHCPEPGHGSVA